jgi:hypothetical protein
VIFGRGKRETERAKRRGKEERKKRRKKEGEKKKREAIGRAGDAHLLRMTRGRRDLDQTEDGRRQVR